MIHSKHIQSTGNLKLNETNSGLQLTDPWLDTVFDKSGNDEIRLLVKNARDNDTLKRAVTAIDGKTGELVITPIEF